MCAFSPLRPPRRRHRTPPVLWRENVENISGSSPPVFKSDDPSTSPISPAVIRRMVLEDLHKSNVLPSEWKLNTDRMDEPSGDGSLSSFSPLRKEPERNDANHRGLDLADLGEESCESSDDTPRQQPPRKDDLLSPQDFNRVLQSVQKQIKNRTLTGSVRKQTPPHLSFQTSSPADVAPRTLELLSPMHQVHLSRAELVVILAESGINEILRQLIDRRIQECVSDAVEDIRLSADVLVDELSNRLIDGITSTLRGVGTPPKEGTINVSSRSWQRTAERIKGTFSIPRSPNQVMDMYASPPSDPLSSVSSPIVETTLKRLADDMTEMKTALSNLVQLIHPRSPLLVSEKSTESNPPIQSNTHAFDAPVSNTSVKHVISQQPWTSTHDSPLPSSSSQFSSVVSPHRDRDGFIVPSSRPAVSFRGNGAPLSISALSSSLFDVRKYGPPSSSLIPPSAPSLSNRSPGSREQLTNEITQLAAEISANVGNISVSDARTGSRLHTDFETRNEDGIRTPKKSPHPKNSISAGAVSARSGFAPDLSRLARDLLSDSSVFSDGSTPEK